MNLLGSSDMLIDVIDNMADDECKFLSLDDFLLRYTKYERDIIALYQILRDLMLKKSCRYVDVIDGGIWSIDQYFIAGQSKWAPRRIYVPIHMDDDVDIPWLISLYNRIVRDGGEIPVEMYLAIYTQESIIYNQFELGIPQWKDKEKKGGKGNKEVKRKKKQALEDDSTSLDHVTRDGMVASIESHSS